MQTQVYPNRFTNRLSTIKKQIKSLLFLSLIVLFQSLHAQAGCTVLTNVIPCGSTTCSLSAIQPSCCAGSGYEWHTVSSNPTASTCITNPAAVGGGTYYLYKVTSFFGYKSYTCANYSASCSLASNCAPSAPAPPSTVTLPCGYTTCNLTTVSCNPPSGASCEWHSCATNLCASNCITNLTSCTPGTYYCCAFKILGSVKYYSSCVPVTVALPNCTPTPPAPPSTVTLPCGYTTCNLTTISCNPPSGATCEWHSCATNLCATNCLTNLTSCLPGTYYCCATNIFAGVKYYSSCVPVTVALPNCTPTPPAPPSTVTLPCGYTTCNLTTISCNPPSGATCEWHSCATNLCATNCLTNLTSCLPGTYYCCATNIFAGVKYYSSCVPVTVVASNNCIPATPIPTKTSIVIPCGSTCADLSTAQPTPASGTTLQWSTCSTTATNASNPCLVSNTTCVTPGTYYLDAYYWNGAAYIFSAKSVAVTVTAATSCPPATPIPTKTSIVIPCGSTCADLTTAQPTPATGTYLQWSNCSTQATNASNPCLVNNANCVTPGTYYVHAFYWNGAAFIFSAKSVAVTVTAATSCPPATPVPTATSIVIPCGSTCADLTTVQPTPATGTYLQWSNCSTQATNASNPCLVNNANCVTPGTYYVHAFYWNGAAFIFSAKSVAVTVTAATSCPPATPVPTATSIVIPCGSTCADLTTVQPTPATGTYLQWSNCSTQATNASNPCLVNNANCVTPGTYYVHAFYWNGAGFTFSTKSVAVTISQAVCNLPPVALNDYDTVQPNFIATGNVILNDNDPQGSALTVTTTPLVNATNGSVVLNANGTFTYTITNAFIGIDSFKYQLCNALGLCTNAWVYIIAPSDLYRLAHHTTNTIASATNVIVSPTYESVNVYPVPTSNEININFNAATEQKVTAEILSMDGKMMAQQSFNASMGINHNTINVSQLENGIYMIRLLTSNNTYLNKITVSH